MRSALHPRRRTNPARLGLLRLIGRGLASSPPTSPIGTVQRVLLVRPDHIGDVLLTSPAVALLRDSLPGAQLTYLVGPWSAAVVRAGPRVDSLRVLAFPGFTRAKNPNVLAPYALLVREAARLRGERYDLAVVFRPDHWWGALLALAAGIPVRVGGRTPETTPLLSHRRAARPGEPASLQALGLAQLALQVVGAPQAEASTVPIFRLDESCRAAAAGFWERSALNGRHVVAVQPSAGAPLKSWPVSRWAHLADRLIERGNAVLLAGGPDDGPLLTAIQAGMTHLPSAVTYGQSLAVSAAMYQRCGLLVGLDGGQAHLAAAVGTPTVRLYGPASADVFGPWPPRADQRVLVASQLGCVPCGQLEAPPCGATGQPACLVALSVDDVLEAVSAQLGHG